MEIKTKFSVGQLVAYHYDGPYLTLVADKIAKINCTVNRNDEDEEIINISYAFHVASREWIHESRIYGDVSSSEKAVAEEYRRAIEEYNANKKKKK